MSFVRYAPQGSDLQTGDLVWPRADDQLVFFRADNPQAQPWLEKQASANFQVAESDRSRVELFTRDVWVGHVALIELRDGIPWVVDATPSRSGAAIPGRAGVATQTYADFLADDAHARSHIWHGRMKAIESTQASALLQAAKAYLGRPYDISPFGFEQTNDFYCSKLIWHCIQDALGLRLKKKAWSWPLLWFTPWDVMASEHVQLLYEPPDRSYIG